MPLVPSSAGKVHTGVRATLGLVLLALVLLVGGWNGAGRPAAAQQAGQTGVQVTLAATAEDLEPATPGALAGGLEIQITLLNQTGHDLAGLRAEAPVPASSHVTHASLAQNGQSTGLVEGQRIHWDGLALANGATLGPFFYRVLPDQGVDGAVIFRQAAVQPQVTWSQPSPGSAVAPELPLNGLWGETGLRRTVLPTGLTIFTQERRDTPTVALRVAARAGSRDEDDSTCGGSHWLEHAHFLGTTRRPDNQAIGRAISTVGGEFNASTGWEATSFWNLVPADKFDVAIDVLSDQMMNSTFPPEAFEREKQVIIQEIKLRFDTPSIHAFDDFLGLVFQTSSLRRSPAATVCLLSLPISTILQYRAEHYTTSNMAIAASGNLQHDDAVAKIAQAFAGLPQGPRIVRPRMPEPVEQQPRLLRDGSGTGPAEIRLGWPAPGQDDPDWPAMVVLDDLLSNVGQRLKATVRDNRVVATDVDSTYLDFSDAGAEMLQATADPNQIDRVVALFLAEVQRLRNGEISDADVQMSIRAYAGARALDEELNLAQTQRATEEAAGTLLSYEEVLAQLRTVQPADVQRVAQKYLDPANYTLVILQQ